MTTLDTELRATAAHLATVIPEDAFAEIGRSIGELAASGDAERATGPGGRPGLPTLPSLDGGEVDLAARSTSGPLVLLFYRGGWCPYCNVTLRAYQQAAATIGDLGASIVAITPELPEQARATIQKNGLGFEILLDRENRFARSLGLVFTLPDYIRPRYAALGIDLPAHNGDGSFELPMPVTYVVARDGTIVYAFVEADFTRRAEPDDVLAVLRRLDGRP